jgi:hypothetical protein
MKQASSLLPVLYAHVVFTVPEQLAPLALRNQRLFYNLLFRAASATLLEIAADPRHTLFQPLRRYCRFLRGYFSSVARSGETRDRASISDICGDFLIKFSIGTSFHITTVHNRMPVNMRSSQCFHIPMSLRIVMSRIEMEPNGYLQVITDMGHSPWTSHRI